jgi:hypothetical protein
MIDPNVFLQHMSLLASRFQRPVDPHVFAGYKLILDEQLTLEQFQKAVLEVFRADTFFPTPERLIDAGLGDLTALAQAQWCEMLAAARADRRSEIDQFARAAVNEMGGTSVVRQLGDHNQLLRVRSEFVAAYTRHARAARQPLAKALQGGV